MAESDDVRILAMRWKCVCGAEMPLVVEVDGVHEALRFCGVCGKPRRPRSPSRELRDWAVFRTRCSVSFDGELQVTADGRRRGLWFFTRVMNAFGHDTETATLLEWDTVRALQDRLSEAAETPDEHPERLIAACAAEHFSISRCNPVSDSFSDAAFTMTSKPTEERMTKPDQCPACGASDLLSTTTTPTTFEYGSGATAVTLEAVLPIHMCGTCDTEFTLDDAEVIRHEAVCRHRRSKPRR
jgi:hypothetical protein